MISFDNTEIAFSAKNEGDLRRSYWLFKMVSSNIVVRIGSVLTNLSIKLKLPIKAIIKATIFKQFCGGESIKECDHTIEELARFDIKTILDYSIEGKVAEEDFEATAKEIVLTIEKAKGNKNIPFSVFKVTGIASLTLLERVSSGVDLSEEEDLNYEGVKNRVNSICKKAFESDVPVFIDAEESWIQQAIDNLANEMMSNYNKEKAIVYNTFQLYRNDRLEYLEKSYKDAESKNFFLGAKLVRGAYMEKERERASELGYPSPIYESKEKTDEAFDSALSFCIEKIDRVAICAGTHNEKSTLALTRLMLQKNMDKSHSSVFFSQLLGMSDHISYNLANEGYNVAKYVPYGPIKEVLPYLIRRAQENTSVKGQTGRELSLINKEMQRRKRSKDLS